MRYTGRLVWIIPQHLYYLSSKKVGKGLPAFSQNARFDVNLPDSDAKLFKIAYRSDSIYLYIKNDEKKRFFGEI
ncbi:MAG TPA: hypothetical protein VGB00_10665, partial [Pyrinomonadaceae bacterium]